MFGVGVDRGGKLQLCSLVGCACKLQGQQNVAGTIRSHAHSLAHSIRCMIPDTCMIRHDAGHYCMIPDNCTILHDAGHYCMIPDNCMILHATGHYCMIPDNCTILHATGHSLAQPVHYMIPGNCLTPSSGGLHAHARNASLTCREHHVKHGRARSTVKMGFNLRITLGKGAWT